MRGSVGRKEFVRFYTPGGYPVSASKALSIGAELVDSISLLHGLEEVAVTPSWWRRICGYMRYARCTEREPVDGLRVLVVVDSRHYLPPVTGADLVYEMDSRRGSILRIGGAVARL